MSDAGRTMLMEMLKVMVSAGASDLHLTQGAPPKMRVDGELRPVPGAPQLTKESVQQLCYGVLTDDQRRRFETEQELDLSFGVKDLSRFRGNIFLQQGAVAAVFRQIPYKVRSFDELGLPPVVRELSQRPRGLVLVTGPTGSGKSSTLATIIDAINQGRHEHIVTIEDPVEFIHPHKNCLVNQREVGADTQSFKRALKYILRQDPDVVLLGELRDLETIEAALTIAETGHLCFATLHTNSCVQTINRIIDVFPDTAQSQVRTQLSFVLEGVLSQTLVPKRGGGRALALEIMVPNAAIRALIREDKAHQIYSQMQMGQGKSGMQTMNQALCELVLRNQVELEVALGKSSDIEELRTMLANPTMRAKFAPQPPIR